MIRPETVRRIAALPNAGLLLSLLALVLLYPFLEPRPEGRAAIAIWDLLILVLALRAASATGPEHRIGYLLAIPAIALHVVASFVPGPGWLQANFATQAMFHAFVCVCLLRYILRDEVMTLDELFAAAGCYVLMAFVFAYVYALVERYSPGSFAVASDTDPVLLTSWFELLYFSFTALTSVGFGDITPVNNHARSLVMIEQMVGVLYLALIISRLVALQAARVRNEKRGTRNE
ncbi:potassium channel family protein [Arenimonas composti]|uniref:Potassium channel domain-containing protein n=1 Tax=Arenimonas composti TR7-09 = DSM 18010 TaxID=1121013 RepID=A0A091BFD0_9GAMM|nr:potassium channel family protein [Arenimonas composti]KFN51408.1 hypothetical protein P873_02775 [Arenimonas composti TR7-09 = DSM 18010]